MMDVKTGFLDGFTGSAAPRSIAIKDSIDIAGQPTGLGSSAFVGVAPAASDAEVVARLRRAGWTLSGKTRLHEMAYGVSGLNHWQGTAPNPLFPALIPGGSSSGSASVVAAGLVTASLGTDTGGSVRIPAACCGVIGLKPGYGRVSRRGVAPEHSSLDCVGIFTRTLAPMAEVLGIIADGPLDAAPDRPLRAARLRGAGDARIETCIDAVLATSGMPVVGVELPGMTAAFDAGMTVIAAENARSFGSMVGKGLFGPDIETRLAVAMTLGEADVAAAERVRHDFRAEVDALFAEVDILLTPALAVLPPSLAEQARDPTAAGLTAMVRPFNLTGHPALVLPMGTVDGRPVSLQIVGPMGAEATLLAAAARIRPDLA